MIAHFCIKLVNSTVKSFYFFSFWHYRISNHGLKAKFDQVGWDFGTEIEKYPKILTPRFGPFHRTLLLIIKISFLFWGSSEMFRIAQDFFSFPLSYLEFLKVARGFPKEFFIFFISSLDFIISKNLHLKIVSKNVQFWIAHLVDLIVKKKNQKSIH